MNHPDFTQLRRDIDEALTFDDRVRAGALAEEGLRLAHQKECLGEVMYFRAQRKIAAGRFSEALAGLDLARENPRCFGLFIGRGELLAKKIGKMRNLLGIKEGPDAILFHAFHEDIGNPVGDIQVVGATRQIACVVAEFEELLDMGAKDIVIIPAIMKKGRPAHVIKVIAKPEDTAKIARKIIIETGSLGIRVVPTRHRLIAARKIEVIKFEVEGQLYEAAVKIARDSEGILLNISAEFEDCKKIAKTSGVPVKEVIRKVEEAARNLFF